MEVVVMAARARHKIKESLPRARRPSAAKLIEDYQDDLKLQGIARSTLESRKYRLRSFCAFLEYRKVHVLDASREDIKAWVEFKRFDCSHTTASIKNSLTAISGLYDFLEYEGLIGSNPVPAVRKRYMRSYKNDNECHTHQLLTVEQMAALIKSALDVRDRAILLVLAKTGIRRNELASLDVIDVNLEAQSIILKPTAKRSNRQVFFDDECHTILARWLAVRRSRNKYNCPSLFINQQGERLGRNGINQVIKAHAIRCGLYNADSDRLEDHLSAHSFRHWNVTHLLRSGMRREYVQWLRGDAIKEAVDTYFHIDPEDVKEAYQACIPQLGL